MAVDETAFEVNEVSTNYPSFTEIENKIISFWQQFDVSKLIKNKNIGKKPLVFLEGPPTANGMPHIGHALTRVIKDSFLRYYTMRGYYVTPRIGGWDCHGLPVELEIEKQLGINSKDEIEAYGIEKFNELCRQSVLKYTNEWIKMSERIGFVLDMHVDAQSPFGAYVTMTTPYIESVWWSLKTLYDRKLLFLGHKIVPYCPRCGTSLSSHELALGYKDVDDPSIYVKFQLKDSSQRILVWTTTPWTLLSNLLLAVKEDAEYVVVEDQGEQIIVAKALSKKLFPKAKIVESFLGKKLVGLNYESLFPYATSVEGKKHFIVSAPFVGTEEGSGIVHIAPAFGEDDFNLCQQYNVPMFNPVDERGRFKPIIDLFKGQFVNDADKEITKYLKSQKILFKTERITHTYPFCWRCDSPLLYYAGESWFIRMSSLRENLVKNNNQVRWQPEHLKDGRFGNFIVEAKDWALSRSRYWGTPLPIWNCPEKHEFAIGSIAELKKYASNPSLISDISLLDLHKPFIDTIKIKCPTCGKISKRVPYVIDTWYDSGSAYFAQWHYPFENKDLFEKHFPVDFITESQDQTRGWFYTLLATSTAIFDKPAYLNCLTMGHILAEDGNKMSKSKGNTIAPDEAIGMYGADALRYYLCSAPVWKSTRFGLGLIRESVRSFQFLLWNVITFYRTYTQLDNWQYNPNNVIPVVERSELDQYAVSSLQSTIQQYIEGMENLEIHRSMDVSRIYLDEILSNWWIRRSRRRFWDRDDPQHETAYQTLFEIISTFLKMLAPVIPFVTEHLYQEIIRPVEPDSPSSIHLCDFPEPNPEFMFPELEKTMNIVRTTVIAGRMIRANVNIKNRQPLSLAKVIIPDNVFRTKIEAYKDILKDELNVKNILFLESAGELQEFKILPNHTTLGPKFRKETPNVVSLIDKLTPEKIKEIIKLVQKDLSSKFKIGEYDLSGEDIKIKITTQTGYEAAEIENGLLFLSTDLSDLTLQNEGIIRDFIRRIQTTRREMDLPYDALIKTSIYSSSNRLINALNDFKDLFMQETLTKNLLIRKKPIENAKKWDFIAFEEKIEFDLEIKQL